LNIADFFQNTEGCMCAKSVLEYCLNLAFIFQTNKLINVLIVSNFGKRKNYLRGLIEQNQHRQG